MKPYPWQLALWKEFEQKIVSLKTPHAMLFSGSLGIGKLHFAKAFVYRLFCQDVQQSMPCGVCKACHLLNVDNHPDFYGIEKLEDKKNISVDQIRQLIGYVNLTPHSASKKVVIIEQGEHMSIAASNSLLKTLEEPPDSCLIILLTHRPDKLLATIRSRCQQYSFLLPEYDIALSWLKTNVGKANEPKLAEKLLALANGAPLQALSHEKNNMLVQYDAMFTALKALGTGELNPISAAKAWLKMDLDMTLYCMNSWLTDMVRLKVTQEPPVLGNPNLRTELVTMSQRTTLAHMLEFYQFINKIHRWQQSNINTQLILEEMLVKWTQLVYLKKANA